jgi:hypothetical protein
LGLKLISIIGDQIWGSQIMNYDEKSREDLINENIDLIIQVSKYKKKNKEPDKQISDLYIAFHSLGDGIIIVDKECKIVLSNIIAEQLT